MANLIVPIADVVPSRPPGYDPTKIWNPEDGSWAGDFETKVRGGGRYRNTITVISYDSNDKGIIYTDF